MKKTLSTRSTSCGHFFMLRRWAQLMLILVGELFFSAAANGQTQQWDKTYGGAEADFLSALQPTQDGGYILGGYSYSDSGGDKTSATWGDCIPDSIFYRYANCTVDFWVVKLDADGNKLWDKTFGGYGDDRLTALQQTRDGGYLLGGTSLSGLGGDKTQDSLGRQDYWVIKIDAAGNKQWDRTFGGGDSDELYALQQTTDGGYLLGGDSRSDAGGDKSEAKMTRCTSENGCTPDFWVVRLDAAGNKLWDRTLGGRAFEHLAGLRQTPDGGYVLGGYSYSGSNGNKTAPTRSGSADFWLVKLDAAGQQVWDKSYGSDGRDLLTALQLTSDGGFILGGYVKRGFNGDITGDNNGDSDYWVIKLDAAGNKHWDKTFGGRDPDFLTVVQQTSEGGYILAGRSYSYTFEGDYSWGTGGSWVIKLDAAGNKQWDKTFAGAGRFPLLHQTRDGGYILGATADAGIFGDKTQPGRGHQDYWLVKISGEGGPIVLQFDAFSPQEGLPGSTVTFKGKNLYRTESVWFYGGRLKKAKFKVVNNSTIEAIVPPSAKTGKITLYAVDDTVTSTGTFQVRQPVLTGIRAAHSPKVPAPAMAAYPNPFHTQVTFRFTLPGTQPAAVKVYDLLGREVKVLYQGVVSANQIYQVEWQPQAHQPAGLYVLKLQASGLESQLKVLLNR